MTGFLFAWVRTLGCFVMQAMCRLWQLHIYDFHRNDFSNTAEYFTQSAWREGSPFISLCFWDEGSRWTSIPQLCGKCLRYSPVTCNLCTSFVFYCWKIKLVQTAGCVVSGVFTSNQKWQQEKLMKGIQNLFIHFDSLLHLHFFCDCKVFYAYFKWTWWNYI